MADAAEAVAGLPDGTIRLKWPNDLVVGGQRESARVRKLAGVLGETDGLGTDDPRVVVGLGINADWPAARPSRPTLADSMTSLREATGGRPVDRDALTDAFVGRLEARVEALRADRFDKADWADRQSTTGRIVELVRPDGTSELVRALGVESGTGALLVEDAATADGSRPVLVGEIRHARLAPTVGV